MSLAGDSRDILALAVRDCRRVMGRTTSEPVEFRLEDLSVRAGEQIALTGPSGCGKSTLLNLVSGMLRPDSGEIKVLGIEITALAAGNLDAFRGKNIGFVYQTFNLLHEFTAIENVLLGMKFGRAVPVGSRREQARALLHRMGLHRQMDLRPPQLSVGERQRVAIARAISNNPAIIIADEPTGSLDPESAGGVLDLLLEVTALDARTLLLVTHDEALANRLPRHFDCRGLIHRRAASEVPS